MLMAWYAEPDGSYLIGAVSGKEEKESKNK
jgi:hypothetical protein